MLDTKTLEKLIDAQKFQAGAWHKVIETARKCAMLELHSSYIDQNGVVNNLCRQDADMQLDYFKKALFYEIKSAFLEDALLGKAVAEAKPPKGNT